MPATGGSEEPAAPVPSTVPPDSEQVVLTEEDEIAELGAVPTADPDRVAEDEAADEGDLQPRQFLGATGDGLGGAEEPVHDDAPSRGECVNGACFNARGYRLHPEGMAGQEPAGVQG